jgi:hypothetical protein
MKKKYLPWILGIGAGVLFPALWWVSGYPFPTHRGIDLLALVVETPLIGATGFCAGKSLSA